MQITRYFSKLVIAMGMTFSLAACAMNANPIHSNDLTATNEVLMQKNPVYASIVKHNFKALKVRLDEKHNPNQIYAHRLTPLMLAVIHDNFNAVKYLISNGANVNAQMDNGTTPLELAVRFNRVEMADYLIRHHANSKQPTSLGINLATYAFHLYREDPEQYRSYKLGLIPRLKKQMLIARGFLIEPKYLTAIKRGRIRQMMRLERHNIDIYATDKVNRNAISLAAERGFISLLKHLVKKNLNLNYYDMYLYTPIVLAGKNKHISTVDFLVQNGADINNIDGFGNSIFHKAIKLKARLFIKYLINHNVKMNPVNNRHQTPLDIAIKYKLGKKSITYLRDHGADTYEEVLKKKVKKKKQESIF